MIVRVGAVCAAFMLAGCSTLSAIDESPSGDSFSGRLSVQVAATDTEPAHSMSAAFELRGSAERGWLDLNNPLGSTVARARWEPGSVLLETPQGQSRHASVADMTRAVIGEALPVSALFDWLHGRPWPGSANSPTSAPEPSGFRQLGWRVDLSRLADSRLQARRESPPLVTVQIKLDAP